MSVRTGVWGAHLLHGLLVVPEVLQLPLGPLRELLEDLLPPSGSLGRCDGQGERLQRGGQACKGTEPQGRACPPTAGLQARLFRFV